MKGNKSGTVNRIFDGSITLWPFPCNEGEAASAFVLMQTQFSFLVEMKLKNTNRRLA